MAVLTPRHGRILRYFAMFTLCLLFLLHTDAGTCAPSNDILMIKCEGFSDSPNSVEVSIAFTPKQAQNFNVPPDALLDPQYFTKITPISAGSSCSSTQSLSTDKTKLTFVTQTSFPFSCQFGFKLTQPTLKGTLMVTVKATKGSDPTETVTAFSYTPFLDPNRPLRSIFPSLTFDPRERTLTMVLGQGPADIWCVSVKFVNNKNPDVGPISDDIVTSLESDASHKMFCIDTPSPIITFVYSNVVDPGPIAITPIEISDVNSNNAFDDFSQLFTEYVTPTPTGQFPTLQIETSTPPGPASYLSQWYQWKLEFVQTDDQVDINFIPQSKYPTGTFIDSCSTSLGSLDQNPLNFLSYRLTGSNTGQSVSIMCYGTITTFYQIHSGRTSWDNVPNEELPFFLWYSVSTAETAAMEVTAGGTPGSISFLPTTPIPVIEDPAFNTQLVDGKIQLTTTIRFPGYTYSGGIQFRLHASGMLLSLSGSYKKKGGQSATLSHGDFTCDAPASSDSNTTCVAATTSMVDLVIDFIAEISKSDYSIPSELVLDLIAVECQADTLATDTPIIIASKTLLYTAPSTTTAIFEDFFEDKRVVEMTVHWAAPVVGDPVFYRIGIAPGDLHAFDENTVYWTFAYFAEPQSNQIISSYFIPDTITTRVQLYVPEIGPGLFVAGFTLFLVPQVDGDLVISDFVRIKADVVVTSDLTCQDDAVPDNFYQPDRCEPELRTRGVCADLTCPVYMVPDYTSCSCQCTSLVCTRNTRAVMLEYTPPTDPAVLPAIQTRSRSYIKRTLQTELAVKLGLNFLPKSTGKYTIWQDDTPLGFESLLLAPISYSTVLPTKLIAYLSVQPFEHTTTVEALNARFRLLFDRLAKIAPALLHVSATGTGPPNVRLIGSWDLVTTPALQVSPIALTSAQVTNNPPTGKLTTQCSYLENGTSLKWANCPSVRNPNSKSWSACNGGVKSLDIRCVDYQGAIYADCAGDVLYPQYPRPNVLDCSAAPPFATPPLLVSVSMRTLFVESPHHGGPLQASWEIAGSVDPTFTVDIFLKSLHPTSTLATGQGLYLGTFAATDLNAVVQLPYLPSAYGSQPTGDFAFSARFTQKPGAVVQSSTFPIVAGAGICDSYPPKCPTNLSCQVTLTGFDCFCSDSTKIIDPVTGLCVIPTPCTLDQIRDATTGQCTAKPSCKLGFTGVQCDIRVFYVTMLFTPPPAQTQPPTLPAPLPLTDNVKSVLIRDLALSLRLSSDNVSVVQAVIKSKSIPVVAPLIIDVTAKPHQLSALSLNATPTADSNTQNAITYQVQSDSNTPFDDLYKQWNDIRNNLNETPIGQNNNDSAEAVGTPEDAPDAYDPECVDTETATCPKGENPFELFPDTDEETASSHPKASVAIVAIIVPIVIAVVVLVAAIIIVFCLKKHQRACFNQKKSSSKDSTRQSGAELTATNNSSGGGDGRFTMTPGTNTKTTQVAYSSGNSSSVDLTTCALSNGEPKLPPGWKKMRHVHTGEILYINDEQMVSQKSNPNESGVVTNNGW